MNAADFAQLASKPAVAAFLKMLRACEGTAGPNGYRTMFGGELFDDFSDHPRKVITRRLLGGKEISSTAAGAYQFLSRTWDELVKKYGFADFSAASQDAAAVALIHGRGALATILDGRIEDAITQCNREWASLPGAPYGQPTKSMAFCMRVYTLALSELDPGAAPAPMPTPAPAPAPSASPPLVQPAPAKQPPEPARQPVGEAPDYGEPMVPIASIVTAVLPSIVAAIPKLGELFGSGSEVSNRNLKAAQTVLEVVQQATGSVNAQQAAEKMASDPAAREAAASAVQAAWYTITEAGGGGIAGARAADQAGQVGGWQWHRSASFLIALPLLGLVYLVVLSVVFPQLGGQWPSETRTAIATLIAGSVVGGLCGYYFGSMTGRKS